MIDVSQISADLEAVANPYPNRDYDVEISIPEFTSICPRTGQPDFATIEVHYIPDKYIIELKSFKLYLQNYRNMGIFYEAVTNKILEDFLRAIKPKKIEVEGKFNPRGGISTNVLARWPE